MKKAVAVIMALLWAPFVFFMAGNASAAVENPQKGICRTAKVASVQAMLDEANGLTEKGEYAKAVLEYDRVILACPSYASAYFNKGLALSGLEKLEEAVAEFDKAIDIDPGNARYYNNKGNALGRLGRVEEALNAFNRAIEIDPDYASAYYNKSITLTNLGLKKEAQAAKRRAVELDPSLASR